MGHVVPFSSIHNRLASATTTFQTVLDVIHRAAACGLTEGQTPAEISLRMIRLLDCAYRELRGTIIEAEMAGWPAMTGAFPDTGAPGREPPTVCQDLRSATGGMP